MSRIVIDIYPDATHEFDLNFKYQVVAETITETRDGETEDFDVYVLYQSFGLRCKKLKVWYDFKQMTEEMWEEIENAECSEF